MNEFLINKSGDKKPFWIHLSITLIVFIAFIILIARYKVIQSGAYVKRVYEKELKIRGEKLNLFMDDLTEDYHTKNFPELNEHKLKLDEIGAMMYLFDNDSLVYWSSNLVDLTGILPLENNSIVLLNNGWYQAKFIKKDKILVCGLLLLKNEFAYRNEYLVAKFESSAALNESCQISLVPGELNIDNPNGEFLFSIQRKDHQEMKVKHTLVLFILYQLILILCLSLIIKFYKYYAFIIQRKNIIPYLILFDYLLIWIIISYLKLPSILFESYFYSPASFADTFHRSIGELLTNSSFIVFFVYALTLFKENNTKKQTASYLWRIIKLSLNILFFLALFRIYEYIFTSLLQNSPITIDFGHGFISDPTLTIIAFMAVAALSLAFYFIGSHIFRYIIFNGWQKGTQYIIVLIILALYVILGLFLGEQIKLVSLIFIGIFALTCILKTEKNGKITTILLISYLLLFAIYLGLLSTNILTEKELDQRRVIAESIASDRDSMAEYTFGKIIDEILADSVINNKIYEFEQDDNEDIILERIQHYFNYHENALKYIPYVTICDTSRLLSKRPDNYLLNWVEYFENVIAEIGISTSHPNLFFINNYSMNNSYIARLKFVSKDMLSDRYLFIELGSELVPEGLGYPELLIDETSNMSGSELVNYSFAKYMDGMLVNKFGDYFYSLNLENYEFLSKDQNEFDNNEYSHLLIKKDDKTSFIISKKNKDLIETIAPFSYFFIFLTFYLGIFSLMTNFSYKIFKIRISFRNRLQYTFLGIILTSFLVIGAATMIYLVHLNDKKNYEILSEKAHSVLIELEHRLAGEESFSPEMYETLNSWLVKFSMVFFSDINLYSLDGRLIASSRMQIFDAGLLSKLMNVEAYAALAKEKKLLFIQSEKIGNYKYLSAYIPFRNFENKLVAYLNLPYFARQTELQIEITTFLVALVNIYVLFFVIAIIVTILISRRITKPLQLIKNSISGIRLGKSNEKINWVREDEIGGLVTEYNRMIDELSNSAILLARSERESAWREMAKQVAHEITNPLTPMKLSVQYLKKAWDEKEEDWDKRLARFTKTIIEQIDSLSEIANAFSDFAKMPIQKPEEVDLKHIIKNAIELFKDNTSIKYILYLPDDECIVKADKNQLLRVFNNLIKNSIHAIGVTKKGKITISVKKSQNEFIIIMADNGTGIPPEMADKIFTPSFTTKSSGMGLGLAIVKNIILNTGGNIWFESKANIGTTFYISLPKP